MHQETGQSVPRIRLKLFLTFFRIGLFTFGGGFAMLPLIEREITDNKKWIDPDELIDMIALAQSMPGPVAVNASIFIGRRLAGTSGAIAAMLGCTLPSVLVILAVAIGTTNFQNNQLVQYFFTGVLAAVTALILLTAIKMAKRVVHDWITVLLTVAATILVAVFRVHALLIIISGAAVGFALYWLHPGLVLRTTGFDRHSKSGQQDKADQDHTDKPSDTGKGAGS
jgi:chromate transporter